MSRPFILTSVSKHSRAARRGLVAEGNEATELLKLPAVDNGVKKSIIRSTINNEHLLQKKMENSRIRKSNKKKTSTLKNKIERNEKLGGVLATKIEQSIARAKYVQSARRADWDRINKNIAVKETPAEKPKENNEEESDEEYVKNFYKDTTQADYKANNKFALLDEEEA